jgi:hypothetical protein
MKSCIGGQAKSGSQTSAPSKCARRSIHRSTPPIARKAIGASPGGGNRKLRLVTGSRLAHYVHEPNRMLKNDVAHGLTVSPPNGGKLTMRFKSLKRLDLILRLSKDEPVEG